MEKVFFFFCVRLRLIHFLVLSIFRTTNEHHMTSQKVRLHSLLTKTGHQNNAKLSDNSLLQELKENKAAQVCLIPEASFRDGQGVTVLTLTLSHLACFLSEIFLRHSSPRFDSSELQNVFEPETLKGANTGMTSNWIMHVVRFTKINNGHALMHSWWV